MIQNLLNNNILTINKNELIKTRLILKYNSNFYNSQLISITRRDFPNNENRFTVTYFFNCPYINKRLILKVKTNELEPIESISKIFPNATWYEREVWDLFGVFFLNNSNLSRILNDYRFEGHPFRKDFPLTGFNQLQYDISKKRLISTDVELAQQFRN